MEGSIVGVGGYGCVFNVGKTKSGESWVGKMNFNNTSLLNEFGVDIETFKIIQSKIFKSDPDNKYFITTRKVLQLNRDHALLKECLKLEKGKGSEKYDIFLQKRVESSPPIQEWNKRQVQHAIDGLKLLHSIGIVHNDVGEKNFGFLNNLPVYIDMDSASFSKPVRVRENRGIFFPDFNETPEFDFKQLGLAFSRSR